MLKDKFTEKIHELEGITSSSDEFNNSNSPIIPTRSLSSAKPVSFIGLDFPSFCKILQSLKLDHFAKQHIFVMFDYHKVGFIDYRDFLVTVITLATEPADLTAKLYFSLFDSDCDGKLSPEELHFVLASMVEIKDNQSLSGTAAEAGEISPRDSSPHTPAGRDIDVASLFYDIDINHDGTISYDEFNAWFDKNFSSVRDAFIPIFNE